jgi:hypothetical protein
MIGLSGYPPRKVFPDFPLQKNAKEISSLVFLRFFAADEQRFYRQVQLLNSQPFNHSSLDISPLLVYHAC